MIITGCQRSGTMTAADVFGINHEVFFTYSTSESNVKLDIQLLRSESSWLAQPFVSILKNRHKIIHLVRHPLKVIGSLLGINFWHETVVGQLHKPYRDFICEHSSIVPGGEFITKSMNYWLEWNKPLEVFPRIRIEDILNIKHLNSRPHMDMDWTTLFRVNTALASKVQQKAKEYGY